jgi:hypothetical protein
VLLHQLSVLTSLFDPCFTRHRDRSTSGKQQIMGSVELDTKKDRIRLVFGAAAADEDSLVYSSSSPDTSARSSVSSSSVVSDAANQREEAALAIARRKLHGPFDRIILDEAVAGTGEKENGGKVTSMQSKNDVERKANLATTAKDGIASKLPVTQQHLRQPLRHRSPLSRDLVKKTQDAITRAEVSIQQSIIAPRLSRQDSFRNKRDLTAKARREWEQDLAAAADFHEQVRKQRLEALQEKRDLSSQCSHARSRKRREYRLQRLQAIEQESLFGSEVHRDHQQQLRQQEQQRRRMSTEAKEKMRENHREGEQRMKLTRIQEDCALFDERHAGSLAMRDSSRQNAESRRKSFAFRNGDARRIRELLKELERKRLAHDHESYELKWLGEKDAEATQRRMQEERRRSLAARGEAHQQSRMEESARMAREKAAERQSMELKWEAERDVEAYRKKLEQKRRESLKLRNQEGSRQRKEALERSAKELAEQHADIELKLAAERDADEHRHRMQQERRDSLKARNQEARQQREKASQQRSAELMAEHHSFEFKWAGERDAESYRKRVAEKRRASLEQRNKEGHRQRKLLETQRAEALAAEHASYDLEWEAERDAEAYRQELRRQRRESLERRNKERHGHAKVMQELQEIARECETESLVLKWSGEDDAKAYLAKLAEERRKSLQLRGEQVRHHREVAASQRERELRCSNEDERLRSEDQRDVDAYKKACAARERASLQYRQKEARIQRLEEEERRTQQLQIDSSNFELESEARSDVEEYIASCKRRRRLSLAFRAKERRRHAEWLRHQEEQEREARSREVRDRLIDRRYEELARQQERARLAMDAIRHSNCSFNPFLGL